MTTCFSNWRASQPHPGCFPDVSQFLLTLPNPMASTQQSLCCYRLWLQIIFLRNQCYLALQSHLSLIALILHHGLHLESPVTPCQGIIPCHSLSRSGHQCWETGYKVHLRRREWLFFVQNRARNNISMSIRI